MNKTIKAYVAVTLQSIIVGLSFFFVKIVIGSADSFTMLAHRFLLTAICVEIFAIYNKDKISINIKDFIKILPQSIFFPIVFFLFQTIGLNMISSSESGVIYALTPVFTFIVAKILLDEKSTVPQLIFMIMSVVGIIYINYMKGISIDSGSFWGFILTIISAASFAIYNVNIKKLLETYHPFQISYVVIMCGFIFFNVIVLGKLLINGNLRDYFLPFNNIIYLISTFYMSILSSFLTIFLTAFALSNLESTTVSLFQNFSTIISIIAGVILLNESLLYYHYIGIVIVLVGTIGFNLFRKKS